MDTSPMHTTNTALALPATTASSPPRSPRTLIWAPSPAWHRHIRVYGCRDTRGCQLDSAQRYNHFSALPYCAIHWLLQGEVDVVALGSQAVHEPVPRWAVSGCHSVPITAINRGDIHVFSAVFMPYAFHALFGVDLSQLQNKTVDAREVMPAWALRMIEAVAALPSHDHMGRRALIEATLVQHADPTALSDQHDLGWLSLPAGLPIADLPSHLQTGLQAGLQTGLKLASQLIGVGPRQAQRLFLREVGLNMRDFLKLRRTELSFLLACEKARSGQWLNWAEHAADLGYADQSHLVRDYKARTGRTPTQLARDREVNEADWMYRVELPSGLQPSPQPMDQKEGP